MRGDASSQATRLRKEAAIDFGESGYARGQLGDEATALAAEQNPFSVRKSLERGYESSGRDLLEALNDGRLGRNLLFSGERIRQEGELARSFQEQQAGAGREFQGILGGIESGLLEALMRAEQGDLSAEAGAAGRAPVIPGGAGGNRRRRRRNRRRRRRNRRRRRGTGGGAGGTGGGAGTGGGVSVLAAQRSCGLRRPYRSGDPLIAAILGGKHRPRPPTSRRWRSCSPRPAAAARPRAARLLVSSGTRDGDNGGAPRV